jgi:hypothetical protein
MPETKVARVGGHRSVAFKAAPQAPLSGQRPQNATIAADLDVDHAVHFDLDRTLAVIAATAVEAGTALRSLGAGGHNQDGDSRPWHETTRKRFHNEDRNI